MQQPSCPHAEQVSARRPTRAAATNRPSATVVSPRHWANASCADIVTLLHRYEHAAEVTPKFVEAMRKLADTNEDVFYHRCPDPPKVTTKVLMFLGFWTNQVRAEVDVSRDGACHLGTACGVGHCPALGRGRRGGHHASWLLRSRARYRARRARVRAGGLGVEQVTKWIFGQGSF